MTKIEPSPLAALKGHFDRPCTLSDETLAAESLEGEMFVGFLEGWSAHHRVNKALVAAAVEYAEPYIQGHDSLAGENAAMRAELARLRALIKSWDE
jgi:hypothetical protein